MASARWIENGKAKLEAAELPPDLLLHIFSHQTPSAVLVNASVCRSWRKASFSDVIWRRFAADLWATKVYVPQRFRDMLETEGGARKSFFSALKDSKRTLITKEELCSFDWSFRFKRAAGKSWTSTDPYWTGKPARQVRFGTDHRLMWSGGHDGWELLDMAWMFVEPPRDAESRHKCRHMRVCRGEELGGGDETAGMALIVQMGEDRCYPSELVIRHEESWGFLLNSSWVFYASFPLNKSTDPVSLHDKRLNKRVESWQRDDSQEYNQGSEDEDSDDSSIM